MAFNWPIFKTRTLTAVIIVAVMLTGLLWNQWSFFILFSIIHFGCWWEYLKLTEKIHTTSFHLYTKLGFMLAGYGLMLWFCGPAHQIGSYGVKENLSLPVSGAGFLLLIVGIFQHTAVNLKAFGMSAGGLIYISLSWGLMMEVADLTTNNTPFKEGAAEYRQFDYRNVLLPCIIILSVWVNDTMAYIVGSLIGKTLLTKISPKKTWEGTIGGILLCVMAVGLLFSRIPADSVVPGSHILFSKESWYIIPAIAAIAGTFGDLFKSKLKRMAGVKDSGSFMPGHGGFLDRFDSLLLATPAVWIYVKLFML